MVKLSCVTDDTCGSVHNTPQSVSNRLCDSGKYVYDCLVLVVAKRFVENPLLIQFSLCVLKH